MSATRQQMMGREEYAFPSAVNSPANYFWLNGFPFPFEDDDFVYMYDSFTYNWEQLNLAANGTATVSVNILADSNFIAAKGTGSIFAQATKAVITNQDITVRVTDTGSGRDLQNIATQWRHMFGPQDEPMLYTPPKVYPANGTIDILITELDNVAVDIYLTMNGCKQYKQPKNRR